MSCEECTERARLLAASEQLLAEKRFKYRNYTYPTKHRLLADCYHEVATARANLERHLAECTEEKQQ